MKVFVDDYNLIRVENNIYIDNIEILGEKLSHVSNEEGIQYFKTKNVIPLHLADKCIINNVEYPLNVGKVTIKDDFNKRYRYDGFLGNKYTKENTEFRVFSPIIKEMYVVIDDTKYAMEYDNPIWKTKVNGDLENKSYYYLVRLVDKFDKVCDPYAIAGDLEKSIIINLDNTYEQKETYLKYNNILDNVIYEGHIRDLTVNLDIKEDKTSFLGLTKQSEFLGKSVLEYIKDLGVTHLQLLPVQDFIGVDALNKEKEYNWGYNPQSYFTLQGWHSANPLDPYKRINELKELVDSAHKLKLGINIDVVYNHVYERHLFPYDRLVPGYFYRHDEFGKSTNSSYCGNDIETRNYMVRRLIVDSLVYLTKTFKVDGFRFDLMGLMDIDTMLQIEKALREINPKIMLYGEGWNMNNAVSKEQRSHMHNNHLFPTYAHFNDSFRNIIKGELHSGTRGYANGDKSKLKEVKEVLLGTTKTFEKPTRSINYVECHDNYTLYDQMIVSNVKKEELKDYQDLANHLIAISKGIIFYHAGQELYRTKQLVENSYKDNDEINGLKWVKPNSLNKFKEILLLRKKYFNKPGETLKARLSHDLIYLNLQNKKNEIVFVIKNDYKEDAIKEKGNLIFESQETNLVNNKIVLNKPGVYAFLVK